MTVSCAWPAPRWPPRPPTPRGRQARGPPRCGWRRCSGKRRNRFRAPHRDACRHLAAARAETRPDLAEAFAALEPELEWRTRAFADAPADFADYHANARLLGPDGLERRGELVAGFSLVAPGVTYPEHDHPPEEIYLVLSGGEWWQAGGAWHAPGPCGIVHNPPGIRHAMRGTSVPLLAIWFLLPN